MQASFNGLKVLFCEMTSFDEMKKLPAKKVFDDGVCSFLNELSVEIRKDKESKGYPDIVTFGFFCRKANIESLKNQYYEEGRIGRGLSFHIAPSNVPINFAYTLVAGLLAGNSCVVRTSTKDFAQTRVLCRLMQQVLERMDTDIGKYIAVVQYGRDKEINDALSAMSDVRVIWGGDTTISEIRKSEIPSRCVEITFADRYSLCVLNAKDILNLDNLDAVVQNFYNDTYLYDQNACSSPKLMYWIGGKEEIKRAKSAFWGAVKRNIEGRYIIEPVIAVDKTMMDYRAAIELENVIVEDDGDNLFHRIRLENLDESIVKYVCPGGSFLEYDSTGLNELEKIVTKKYQTLSYLGGDKQEIYNWVIESGVPGIDRIVPIGKTADFTLTWDGYNLIETMSRKVWVE